MPTTDDYCQRLAQKLGILETGTTTLEPDLLTETDAVRVIVSESLYDSEGESDKFAGCFAFIPIDAQVARCHGNGFSMAEITRYTQPVSGVWDLTLVGYGTTATFTAPVSAATVQAAIRDIAGFEDATVSGTSIFQINLGSENPVDILSSFGTIVTRAVGRVRVTKPFSWILLLNRAFRITGPLPWVDYDGWKGLRSFVNDALGQTPFVYRVPLTATRADQRVFDLAAEVNWLKLRKQVIGLYSSGLYAWTASFTPPGSSTYTLSLRLGATTYTTASLAFSASAGAVQAALATAIADTGVSITVSGTSPKTISIASSCLYPLIVTASAGTVGSQATTELTEPDFLGPGGAFSYRNGFPVFEADPFVSTTETRFLACYRRSSTWVAPQTDWQTPGPTSGYAASTTGLVSLSDQAQPDVEIIANLAYAMACEYLWDRTKDDAWAKKLTRVGQQALWANVFDSQEDRNPGRAGRRFGFGGGWQKLPGGGLAY